MNVTGEKMVKYYSIYDQVFEDPFILLPDIAQNTKLSEKEVSQLLGEMYSQKILQGPMVFVKPAENYSLYVYFLKVREPLSVFQELTEDYILFKTMGFGDWDLMVISSEEIDFTKISGFKDCVYSGEKGKTVCSKVSELDWEQCIKKMHAIEHLPDKKTSLYEKIPEIPWGDKEWELFETFKLNVRKNLEKPGLEMPEDYEKWCSQLLKYAVVNPALYPQGVSHYVTLDFLFCSQYQEQLSDILGLLPATVIFFSTGDHVWARTWVIPAYASDVYGAVDHVKDAGYCSEFYSCNSLFTG